MGSAASVPNRGEQRARIHAEAVCSLALAAVSTRFRSPGLNRTGSMVPLACPFAILGRPGFLGFACLCIGSQLLRDGYSGGCLRGYCGGSLENGHVPDGVGRIVCFMRSMDGTLEPSAGAAIRATCLSVLSAFAMSASLE